MEISKYIDLKSNQQPLMKTFRQHTKTTLEGK